MNRRNSVLGFAVLFAIVAYVSFVVGTLIEARRSRELGRIDIASGRVVGERVTNADGLAEWQ